MNPDKITTFFGTLASISTLLAQQGVYPQWTGLMAALCGSAFAYYSKGIPLKG